MTSAKMALGVEEIFHGLIDAFQLRRSQSLPAKQSLLSPRRSPLLSYSSPKVKIMKL